jgi:hypothetical protein
MGSALSTYAVPLAVGAVAIVLVFGLVNMMRGGSPDTSQRLMRLRVLLQFRRRGGRTCSPHIGTHGGDDRLPSPAVSAETRRSTSPLWLSYSHFSCPEGRRLIP